MPALISHGKDSIYSKEYVDHVEKFLMPAADALYGLYVASNGDLDKFSLGLTDKPSDSLEAYSPKSFKDFIKNADRGQIESFKEFLKSDVPSNMMQKIGFVNLQGGHLVPFNPKMQLSHGDVSSHGRLVIKDEQGWKEVNLLKSHPMSSQLSEVRYQLIKQGVKPEEISAILSGNKDIDSLSIPEDLKKSLKDITTNLTILKASDASAYASLAHKYAELTGDNSLWDDVINNNELKLVVNKEQAKEAGVKLTFGERHTSSIDAFTRLIAKTASLAMTDETNWTTGSTINLVEGRKLAGSIVHLLNEEGNNMDKRTQKFFANFIDQYFSWEGSWALALTRDPRLQTPLMYGYDRAYALSFFPGGPALPYESPYAENLTVASASSDRFIKSSLYAVSHRWFSALTHMSVLASYPFVMSKRVFDYARGLATYKDTGYRVVETENGNIIAEQNVPSPFQRYDYKTPSLFSMITSALPSFSIALPNLAVGLTGAKRHSETIQMLANVGARLDNTISSKVPDSIAYYHKMGYAGTSIRWGSPRSWQVHRIMYMPHMGLQWTGQSNPGQSYFDINGTYRIHPSIAGGFIREAYQPLMSEKEFNRIRYDMVQRRTLTSSYMLAQRQKKFELYSPKNNPQTYLLHPLSFIGGMAFLAGSSIYSRIIDNRGIRHPITRLKRAFERKSLLKEGYRYCSICGAPIDPRTGRCPNGH